MQRLKLHISACIAEKKAGNKQFRAIKYQEFSYFFMKKNKNIRLIIRYLEKNNINKFQVIT
ncbi:hypothetical protein CTZ24_17620 [Pantoea phytobeneficialis]|uniref:Uncharacterized protein n=1 Tax=Pantoea phytobeneficialis TaxID=2052056 RepID=A0AAP9KQK8_9GAMM|nr:hypothetical protein CTZ24_17620 [Pantoea phytobeneficialis]